MSASTKSEPSLNIPVTVDFQTKLNQALVLLDPCAVQEYQEALEMVPHILAKETPDFAPLESYDATRVAARIAGYWKCRKVVFGPRWLLPLNQTGTGALSMEDVDLLRTAFYVVFERGQDQGPEVLLDESRLPRAAGDANFRIVFYLDYLYRHLPSQVTTLHVVSSRDRPPADMRRDLYAMVLQAIRWNIAGFFVAQAYEGAGKDELMEYLGYKTKRTHEFRTQVPVGRLVAHSRAGTLRILQEKGFQRDQLPFDLGGNYDYGQFANWIRIQMSVEDMMSGAPIMINRLRVPSSSLVVGAGPLDAPVQRKRSGRAGAKQPYPAITNGATTTTSDTNGETVDAAELTRRRNALYSRRSNKRREMTLLSLQDQKDILMLRNQTLQADNARLEYLLAVAQSCVASNKNLNNYGYGGLEGQR